MKHQIINDKEVQKRVELDPKKLKGLRVDRNIPLKDIATILGFKTPGGYLRVESGENKLKAEHLPALASIFNMGINDLMTEIFFEQKLDESSNLTNRT